MASLDSLKRIEQALGAAKRSQMARLGLARRKADAAALEAARLRALARMPGTGTDPFALAAHANWQGLLHERASAADRLVEAALAEADVHRTDLSYAFGRELAVQRLIRETQAIAARTVQRREEDWVQPLDTPQTSPFSGSLSSVEKA